LAAEEKGEKGPLFLIAAEAGKKLKEEVPLLTFRHEGGEESKNLGGSGRRARRKKKRKKGVSS